MAPGVKLLRGYYRGDIRVLTVPGASTVLGKELARLCTYVSSEGLKRSE
jgi:hypothetical protein